MKKVRKKAMEDTYHEIKNMLFDVCNKFKAQFPDVEIEEAESIAGEAFMQAYMTFNPERGQFTTHAYHVVWGALRNEYRKQQSANSRIYKAHLEKEEAERYNARFNYERFMLEATDDAKTLVGMIVNPNKYVRELLERDAYAKKLLRKKKIDKRKRPDKVKILVSLNEYLDWDPDRLVDTYHEVSEFISNG